MSAAQQKEKIDFEVLKELIGDGVDSVMQKLKSFKKKGDIAIEEMFEMQLLMNHLSQLSEVSTQVVAACNQAIYSMARNVK